MAVPVNIKEWTVLIVDDEPDNVGVAYKVLSFYGATVHVASNGREGLNMLRTVQHPTFILLDLSMPEMDGWEMHAQLKADVKLATIPVIALTAHVMEGDEARVMEAGFDGYIAKPFRIVGFLDAVQKILHRVPTCSQA
jgi:CheY-like chemotaxis protein